MKTGNLEKKIISNALKFLFNAIKNRDNILEKKDSMTIDARIFSLTTKTEEIIPKLTLSEIPRMKKK